MRALSVIIVQGQLFPRWSKSTLICVSTWLGRELLNVALPRIWSPAMAEQRKKKKQQCELISFRLANYEQGD